MSDELTNDQMRARIAALETQVMVMQDSEAQALKLRQAREAWRSVEIAAEVKMRKEMEAIGIGTHWSYTAGKTVGAMVTELCELVKSTRAPASPATVLAMIAVCEAARAVDADLSDIDGIGYCCGDAVAAALRNALAALKGET